LLTIATAWFGDGLLGRAQPLPFSSDGDRRPPHLGTCGGRGVRRGHQDQVLGAG